MSWWGRLFHRNQMEDRLASELEFHLEQHASELIEGPAVATHHAEVGNLLSLYPKIQVIRGLDSDAHNLSARKIFRQLDAAVE